MSRRSEAQWLAILTACGVLWSTATRWAPVFAYVIRENTFSKGDADIVEWLPEVVHESNGLQRMEENLNYTSAERIVQVWPSRFRSTLDAYPYVSNPRVLANKVYGGRMGNSRADDGWTYRGRSPIGITGLANYQFVGKLVGQDLVGIPDLLCQPHFALEACIAWWEDKIPDSMLGETTAIRQRVNGGLIGLAEVQKLKALAVKALA